ncbi:hypothetical protein GGI12_001746 [Dipsacomyces acuminosporus]|nr:hypothetical protein GGI12_001746 [Dipsacomyces acuminosporus]
MFVAGKKRKSAASPQGYGGGGSRPKTSYGAGASLAEPVPAQAINRWYKLGLENFRERQFRNALDYYNRAIALSMKEGIKDSKLYEARSHTLYKLREFQRAMDDAKESIVIDGSSPAGYIQMAGILAATGKPKDALAVASRGLQDANQQSASYKHLQAVRESVLKQLDPSYVPAGNAESDPMIYLPEDLCVLILRLLDIRSLFLCRGVSRRWMSLADNTPVLWSNPCYSQQMPGFRPSEYLPSYLKEKQRLVYSRERAIPDRAVCTVFERSRGGLTSVTVPEGSLLTKKSLSTLLKYRRPHLHHMHISRDPGLGSATANQILNKIVPTAMTEVRLPYCTGIDIDTINTAVRHIPQLRVLDISGCASIRMKHFFMAWGTTLARAGDSTRLEELYLNDHPEIPCFLVYSVRHTHFRNLRTLHMAIKDEAVFSAISGIGPLVEYFQRIEDIQTPFPRLKALNMDGVWDATASAHRFVSGHIQALVSRCNILPYGFEQLSALESSAVTRDSLFHTLRFCLGTLRQLHLTKAISFDSEVLTALFSVMRTDSTKLQLNSLDLSGCVGLSAQCLLELVSCCPDLIHVNLGHTATNNAVLSKLTEFVSMPESAGIEMLVLDTTDVTGAAARDFAAACARRFRHRVQSRHAGRKWRLRLLDMDNCMGIGSDAVSVIRDLLSSMSTCVLAAIPE